ncbi:ComF family protein [Nesterenkonia sp. LB17]|uniref:ComF family protein n=1 Tax=Nesterenkonia sp. LB17 TaxID=2901230 RepID=UPI001F4C6B04|nr:phosphoribosyltransferase family protein [Nesterenkonia sp. LB17]MCH8564478.1 ComF family protein [Nesterenkonia sp. LB17]
MDPTRQRPGQLGRTVDRVWFGPTGASVRAALSSAAGIVTPVWCIGCAEQDLVLCALCAEDLRLMTRAPFAAEEQAMALPLLMDAAAITVLPVSAAGRYEGLVARAVLAFKDHGAIGLGAALGPGLARALRLAAARVPPESAAWVPGSRPWLLVSPPSSLRSQLTRGFDPVQVLLDRALAVSARELRQAGLRPHRVPGLLRQSRAAALRSLSPRQGRQKTRGARARRRRSVGSLELTPRGRRLLPGADVLLVDDVLTSGSTLAELHRVLTSAGARIHGAAVLAATPGPGAEVESPLVRASPEA